MDAYARFFPDLLVVALLLFVALALAPAARRLHLPGPAAFLAVGIVAGLTGALPWADLSALRLEQVGAVALYAILFQGGLSTGFAAWRRESRAILLLGLPGTAVTAALVTLVAHGALGLSWAVAALVGVALSPTDPAAVYATLRGRGASERARTILEGESGFNDPVGISLMVVVVAFLASDDATVGDGAVRFVEELGIGAVGGVAGAAALIALLRATPQLEEGLQAVAVLTGAVIVGTATASLHGSGFLAVYVCGLLVADRWALQDGRRHAIPESVSAAAEPVLFGLLGAAFAPVVAREDVVYGVVLTLVTVLAIRPLLAVACLRGAGLSRQERALVSIGGLKGAVPLLLAAYPALELLDEARATEAIVLVATATSVVVQGLALSAFVRRQA